MNKTKLCHQNTKRAAGTSRSLEDYLEALLRLEQAHGGARVGQLAGALGLHKSTVTTTLKQLAARGLVTHVRYAAARVTPAGAAIATRIDTRHRLIREFLQDMLLVDETAADATACRMEHILAPEVLARINALARFRAAHPRATTAWRRAFGRFVARPAPRVRTGGRGG
jgi:DtxR family Mn-dependent transcriptional regulator